MTFHWEVMCFSRGFNLTETGEHDSELSFSVRHKKGPSSVTKASEYRSGCREHGKTPHKAEKDLQTFLGKALSMAPRSHERGVWGEKNQLAYQLIPPLLRERGY